MDSRIGASSQAEVGAAVRHVERKLLLRLEEVLHLGPELLEGVVAPPLAPVGHPSRVNLAPEDQGVFLQVGLVDQAHQRVVALVRAIADSDGSPVEVVPVHRSSRVLDVVLGHNAQFVPHINQRLRVFWSCIEGSQLVFYLDHQNGAAIDQQVGFDQRRQ
jgi:hypothetical protein